MADQQAGYPKNVDSGNELVNEQSTIRSNLRSRFVAGNLIQASDFNDLRTLMNAFQRHYHRYTDIISLKTYGNTGGTSSRDVDTSLLGGYTDPGAASSGSTITASYMNGHVSAVNTLRNHYHDIDDA